MDKEFFYALRSILDNIEDKNFSETFNEIEDFLYRFKDVLNEKSNFILCHAYAEGHVNFKYGNYEEALLLMRKDINDLIDENV